MALSGAFAIAPGLTPGVLYRVDVNAPFIPIVTQAPWTVTANSGTAALDNLGNRPCISGVGGGTAANGMNVMQTTATIRLIQGKRFRFKFSYFDVAQTVSAFAIGLSTSSTAISEAWKSGGTPPANGIALVKRATETDFSLKAVKASGTVETIALPSSAALTSSVWYDYDVVIDPDASIAGKCVVYVYRSANGAGYSLLGYPLTINAGCPDTVAMCFGFQFQAGDSGTSNKGAVGSVGYELTY